MKKILVVEPHPDDAFLSLGWHLEKLWAAEDRTILTVFSNEVRSREAERYAEAIGARSEVLGLEESKMLEVRDPRPLPEVARFLREEEWDVVVFPVGIQHPDHLDVAEAAPRGSWRYLDTPYQTKQKLGEEMRLAVLGKVVRSIAWPSRLKWRRSSVFKSQAKFFHYNEGLVTSLLPEIVVCDASY